MPPDTAPTSEAVTAPGRLHAWLHTDLWDLMERVSGRERGTRWLFAVLALVSLVITLPLPLATARGPEALVLLGSGLVLGTSWVVTYLNRRVGRLADAVETFAVFALALTSELPTGIFAVLVSALWFRSLYGSTRRIFLRPVAYSVAIVAAAALWPHVFDHAGDGDPLHVLASIPMLFVTAIVGRRLGRILVERGQAERLGEVYAQATAELIGATDDAAIRAVAASADEGFCDAVPGLRMAKVDEDGDALAVTALRGPWVSRPTSLPSTLIGPASSGPGSREHHVPDPSLLDDAAGEPCAWVGLSLPVVPRLGVRSWLLVGVTGGVRRAPIRALRGFANHMSLAYAVAEAHAVLTERASTDPLTGLANRAAFTTALEAALAGPPGTEVSVLFVDLDHFKLINDQLGHEAGDQVLREVATRLRRASRPGDVCARLGGDEFAVLLAGADEAAALAAAARVAAAIRAPLRRADDAFVPLSASVGHATVRGGGDPEELLRRADDAMYAAKRARS